MLENCKIISLPTFSNKKGDLSFIESSNHVPFEIKRIYYLYSNNTNSRGNHAHKNLYQLLIAVNGSFSVTLDDGSMQADYFLNNPGEGLLICPMIWRRLSNFSKNSVCLVLASLEYSEDDYFRDYDEFIKYIN